MKKTAIQLLIEELEEQKVRIPVEAYQKGLDYAIQAAKNKLEMEREQSSQNTKLREAAELVVDLWNYEDTEIDRPTFYFAMDILEKELK